MHSQQAAIAQPQHDSPSFSPHNDPVPTPPDPSPVNDNVLNRPDIAAEEDDDDTLHPIRAAAPSSTSRQLNYANPDFLPQPQPLAAALNASTFPPFNLPPQQDNNNNINLPIATVVAAQPVPPLPSTATTTTNNNNVRTSPRRPRRVDYQSLNNGAATLLVPEVESPQVHTVENPLTKPERFNQNMGTNAIVSCRVDYVFPKKPLKEHYLNQYDAKKRIKFRVVGLQKRKTTSNRTSMVLMLQFINNEGPPDNQSKEWFVSYTNCKLIDKGPPNQQFFPKKKGKKRKRSAARNSGNVSVRPNPMHAVLNRAGEDVPDGDESDAEDFHFIEEQDAPPPPTAAAAPARGIDPRYNVKWDEQFQDQVTIDGRGMREDTKPRMRGIEDPSVLTPTEFFLKFLPTKWMRTSLLPATNEELLLNNLEKTSMGELLGWLGIWINMSLHPGYQPRDFFSLAERDAFFHPPYLGNYMSGKRFEQISSAIKLTSKEPPTYRDRFFWVREMIQAFNDETKDVFVPGWLVVVDESMVAFLNKYCPGWTVVKRKPHPMGNEYHTTADCVTKVIFHIEICEGKDKPKEGEHSTTKYEAEMGSKIGALVVRMTEGLHGSGRAVILDSGFGYVPAVVQLKNKGLYATAYIKKHAHWPKYTKAQEAVDEMQGKDVGVVRVRKGTYPSGEGEEVVYLVAQADSKHTSLMLSNWGTTERVGKKKVRRVGGQLVSFMFTKFSHFYYFGRHGVDDNNRERQGVLSFEEAYRPKEWNLRQFGFVIGASLANAHMAYEYFVNDSETNGVVTSKAEFLREVCKGLMENTEWVEEKREKGRRVGVATPRASSNDDDDEDVELPVCKKMRIPAFRLKWNGEEFPLATQKYQKYRCSGKVGRKRCNEPVRTYCLCKPEAILCDDCLIMHQASRSNMGTN